MNPSEEQKGAGAPQAGTASAADHPGGTVEPGVPLDNYEGGSYEDGYPHEPDSASPSQPAPVSPPVTAVATVPRPAAGGGGKTPPPPPPPGWGWLSRSWSVWFTPTRFGILSASPRWRLSRRWATRNRTWSRSSRWSRS